MGLGAGPMETRRARPRTSLAERCLRNARWRVRPQHGHMNPRPPMVTAQRWNQIYVFGLRAGLPVLACLPAKLVWLAWLVWLTRLALFDCLFCLLACLTCLACMAYLLCLAGLARLLAGLFCFIGVSACIACLAWPAWLGFLSLPDLVCLHACVLGLPDLLRLLGLLNSQACLTCLARLLVWCACVLGLRACLPCMPDWACLLC